LLAYGAQFMNQMGGINLVVYYCWMKPEASSWRVGLCYGKHKHYFLGT